MSKVTITNHPLIQHKLSILRDKNTSSKDFRSLVSEIAALECYEATRDLPLQEIEIETPVSKCIAHSIEAQETCVCSYSARRFRNGGRRSSACSLGSCRSYWPLPRSGNTQARRVLLQASG